MRRTSFIVGSFVALLLSSSLTVRAVRADTINVVPGDTFTKIEGAKPGDEVIIAPGTYAFRVHLTQKATAANPIIIRAQDPANPPKWDMGSTLVENAPGSYTAGDRGRGCWQFSGAENIHVSGIVFTNCRTSSSNSAGIRYYNASKGIVVRDCVFKSNDNGLTGGSQDSELTALHSEFDNNGNLNASLSAPTHNIYIYGGTFTLRYSYIHDPAQSQNFHIRAKLSTIEYNWIARAKSYEGDLMADDDAPQAGPYSQEMTVRGNVIAQGNPANKGQIIAMYNDNGVSNLTLKLRVIQNTFVVGFPNSNVVHLSNADGTTTMTAEISNNVISNGKPFLIENTTKGTVSGVTNWFVTGTAPGALTGSVFGATPPFKDAANKDFTLVGGTTAINAANQTVVGLPDREYFANETITKKYRARATAKDIGAFETTTTGLGVGAYDPPPASSSTSSSSSSSSSSGSDGGSSSGSSGIGYPRDDASTSGGVQPTGSDVIFPDDDSGCGCRFVTSRSTLAPLSILGAFVASLLVRARRRRNA